MGSFVRDGQHAWSLIAFAILVSFARVPGAAQDFMSAPSRVVLASRKASHLILSQQKPEYPPLAKHNYIQGHVRLQVLVDREGRVNQVHVLRGHALLAAAALRAIRRWIYRPLQRDSKPTEFLTVVDMNFSLRSKKIEEFPTRPEQDFNRQIQPPMALERQEGKAPNSVRLRLLVSDEGKVMDSRPIAGLRRDFEAAQEQVKSWIFRPAHWGNLAVPWYLDVEVPVDTWPPPQPAGDPGGQ